MPVCRRTVLWETTRSTVFLTLSVQTKMCVGLPNNDSSDFVPAFVGKYGYPLWKEVYRFPEGENVVYAVPVKSVVPDSEINSIWFFSMGQDSTTYRICLLDGC